MKYSELNEITDKIGKLQVELFLINQNYDAEESMKNTANEEKDKVWRFLWNDFRPTFIPNETLNTNNLNPVPDIYPQIQVD